MLLKAASVLLFLLVWQLGAAAVRNPLLLVGPAETLKALFSMAQTAAFWRTATGSSARIVLSFLLALVAGLLLAALAYKWTAVEILLRPYMLVIKSVPVVSFIVLALLWLSSRRISAFIAFLMVLPALYRNSLQGLRSADGELLELAQVFRMGALRKVRLIYAPALKPYLLSASRVALGVCWKAGIAAEVIGISPSSIGGMLYRAKVNLEIPELFAWTAVIVFLCIAFEKLILALLERLIHRLEVLR